jgi:predicted ester cyclase
MPQTSPEAIARQYYELFNSRAFDRAELLVSPQAVFHYPHTKERLIGRAGYRELARTWITAFPDAKVEILSVTVQNAGIVRVDLLGRGTHTGTLAFGGPLTVNPSGRRAELPLVDTLEVIDGMIVNSRLSFDIAELLRRLT